MVSFSPLSSASQGIGTAGSPGISRVRAGALSPAPNAAMAVGRPGQSASPQDGTPPSRALPRGSLLDLSV